MKFLIFIFLFIFTINSKATHQLPLDKKCVLIYYDKSDDKDYNLGEVYSTYLQNLLGHFPELDQFVAPIESYKKGEINKCKSSFYIGSYFDNKVPQDFIDDFINSNQHRAWLGYNIWQIPKKELNKLFGHSYSGLTRLDTKNYIDGKPSFYKDIYYKNEVFDKFSQWVTKEGEKSFAAPYEQVLLKSEGTNTITPIAWAEHNYSKNKIPYALRSNNAFYIADVPFSYVHESDRYMVFADLLFDILDKPAKHNDKYAVIRIEDVHPMIPQRNLRKLTKLFKEEDIDLHISLIPIFYDPNFQFERPADKEFVPMTHSVSFMNWLKKANKNDTVFIWHGTTHQYKKHKNPHTGYSGDDFEFWDAVNNRPLSEDSVEYVLNRLDLGHSYLKQAGITPQMWLTPHYQASALDYYIFADVFDWNVGRVIYFLNKKTNSNGTNKNIQYKASNTAEMKKLRYDSLKDLNVETRGEWFGQLYPYEIYGDVYGQKLIPESLGNPQPFKSEHVWYPRSIDSIIEDAKRNLVIRDSWASLFFHSYLLTDLYESGVGEYPGDIRPLRKLIQSLKQLGYKFINLDQFIKNKKHIQKVQRYYRTNSGNWERK